jgi:ArsR family transcriptional regulator
MDLVIMLKALSDENRLRIFNLLRKEELCVGDLETILDMTQSNVSRHLTKLKSSELIIQQKKAQWVLYRVNPSLLERHPILVEFFYKELDKIARCKKDLERLGTHKHKFRSDLIKSETCTSLNQVLHDDTWLDILAMESKIIPT